MSSLNTRIINITVIVASLGYFVDIYDLTLFMIVRHDSLLAIGVKQENLLSVGLYLLNMQVVGMLIGGIIWGILGDKKGRLSVLFLTILIYSLANIANAWVHNVPQYALARFISGFGLAGELGVGITLVSETMTKEHRGMGTSLIGAIGLFGAVLGYAVASGFDWKIAYYVGGGLGILLLVLRIFVFESGMFEKMKKAENVSKGNFMMLLNNKKRFLKYLYCILLGIPVWYIIGILVAFSTEFAQKELHITGVIVAQKAVMLHYIAAAVGSFIWSLSGQWLRSRKKSLWIAMTIIIIGTVAFFFSFGFSPTLFYIIIMLLGLGQGYWIIFATVAAEQFGTNMRATVSTTAPNFVRGSLTLTALLFNFLSKDIGMGIWQGALITGAVCIGLAVFALYKLEETYGKDLDYVE